MFLKSKRKPHQKAEKYSPSQECPSGLVPIPLLLIVLGLMWEAISGVFGSCSLRSLRLCATQQPSLVSGSLGGPRRPFLFAVLTIRGDYFFNNVLCSLKI